MPFMAPAQPNQRPSPLSCGPRRPVARPPALCSIVGPSGVMLTASGSRLATIRSLPLVCTLAP